MEWGYDHPPQDGLMTQLRGGEGHACSVQEVGSLHNVTFRVVNTHEEEAQSLRAQASCVLALSRQRERTIKTKANEIQENFMR